MPDNISLQLHGQNEWLHPRSLIEAVRHFWGVLQDLDAAISEDTRGSVSWHIESLSMASPAIVKFGGQSRLANSNHLRAIEAELIAGLDLINEAGLRRPAYSDAALGKLHKLAKLQRAKADARLDLIEVFTMDGRVRVGPETLEGIRMLTSVRYETRGSIVGNLESISIHRGNEFRVWEEVSGRPVRCLFAEGMLDSIKKALGKRVLVFGDVRTNHRGEHMSVIVEGYENYPSEEELPTIEEMSGLIDDFTRGLSLGDYIEEIRNG